MNETVDHQLGWFRLLGPTVPDLASQKPEVPPAWGSSVSSLPLCFLFSLGGSLGSGLAPGQEEVTLSGWSSFTMGLSDLKAEGWVS